MLRERYLTVVNEMRFMSLSLPEVVADRREIKRKMIWSARLSTGLFGLTSCPSGNRGPKGWGEVILAEGDAGLRSLIELGFIPCGVCHPEHKEGFQKAAEETIKEVYGLKDSSLFADKSVVRYDVKRVDWEVLLPLLGVTPNRLYIQQDSLDSDYTLLKERFGSLDFELPECWYYDKTTRQSRKYEPPQNLVK